MFVRTPLAMGSSEAWPQTAGTMAKSRHATMPTNHQPRLPRPDKDGKTRDRMVLEYMPSADLIRV
jgi:ribonuclease I